MSENPVWVMADTFVRLLIVETVKVIVWAPVFAGLVGLHVWLSARWYRG